MSWLRFVAGRLLVAVLTLLVLSALVFWATEELPGDAAGVLAGPDATAAERARIGERLGLDGPAHERYVGWTARALDGDLGVSMISGRPVADILADRLGNTVAIVTVSILLIAVLSIGAGLVAGMRSGRRTDRLVSGTTVTLIAVPDFLLATFLSSVFAGFLGVLPGVSLVPLGDTPWQHPELLILPVASLTLGGLGASMRLIRGSVIAAAGSPYTEQARLNGARGAGLGIRHVLPNAVGPGIQSLALMMAGLLGGGIVVETLFNFPGVGYELTKAVAARDVPLVQGLSLGLGALTLLTLLLGDLAAHALDPKLRGGTAG
jgi:peptide/nickel transport system permease protein